MQRRRTAAPAAPAAARPCVAALPSRSWRECFCKPFELSPPNQEEKKDSSQQRATPASSQPSERFQPKEKAAKNLCRYEAEIGPDQASPLEHRRSLLAIRSEPIEAPISRRFPTRLFRPAFRSARRNHPERFKAHCTKRRLAPCFIHGMIELQSGRWWMAVYARPDVPH